MQSIDPVHLLTKPYARASLVGQITPLDHLPQLSAHLGIELHIKRDDLTGLGFGGNKIRQLEFYFGAAQKLNADTVLITGAVQSNYVASAAAAASRLGMRAVLQLEDRVPNMGETYKTSGNVLLGELLGAEHRHYPHGEDESGADEALRAHATELEGRGQRPYVIPLAQDNQPLGALGYMHAASEILAQRGDFDVVVVASGSGQTHIGLLAGLRALGSEVPVFGICVRRSADAQLDRLRIVARQLHQLLGRDALATDIVVRDAALAPGYGQVGNNTRNAIRLMAQTEGLFLDPTYTGKTFAGLLELVRSGDIASGQRVLFVHTGGLAALFAYQQELSAAGL